MMGPIHSDTFFQHRLMLNGVNLRIKLNWAKNVHDIMSSHIHCTHLNLSKKKNFQEKKKINFHSLFQFFLYDSFCLLFNKLIIVAWQELKRQLKFFFVHKTEVMYKRKSFLYVLVSETIRLLEYVLCFSFLNIFCDS